jgi:hypothetical protein
MNPRQPWVLSLVILLGLATAALAQKPGQK